MAKFREQFEWMKTPLALMLVGLLSFSQAWAEAEPAPALQIQQAIEQGQLAAAKDMLNDPRLNEFERGYLQGWLHLKEQNEKAALEVWQSLRLKYPANLELGNNVAVLLMQHKRYAEAQKVLEQTLHADRQVSKALDNLNQLYSYQAQQAYQKVFRRLEVNAPKGVWLALTENSNVAVVESNFAQQDAVLNQLEKWRQAWSNQNVKSYLDAYHENFVPGQGQSLNAWRNARTRSLTAPRFIDVFLADIQLTPLAETLVRVTFNQRYRSDRFQDEVKKVLLLENVAGQWKIVQEVITNE